MFEKNLDLFLLFLDLWKSFQAGNYATSQAIIVLGGKHEGYSLVMTVRKTEPSDLED